MSMGPTPPEPATEGQDLSGGFIRLRISDGTHTHRQRLHVAPFSNSSGSYLYNTPPAGLFSDAGPDITAAGLMQVLKGYYATTYTMTLEAIFSMIGGEPVEQLPVPTVAPVVGTVTPNAALNQNPAAQLTITTRDTAGRRFRYVILSPVDWDAAPPQVWGDNATGNGFEKLVHYLSANGAVRSHAGNKPMAPMRFTACLNRRLRREYFRR